MSSAAAGSLVIERDAEIATWYRIGGRADRLARPANVEELRQCLEVDPGLRVLGAGANLLVDDGGVDGLVVSLGRGDFREVAIDEGACEVVAGAGVDLRRLIHDTARLGLAGLERLGGVPATIGGAVRMNAGGTYGEIGDLIASVRALRHDGAEVILSRPEIDFAYRSSGLEELIITGARLKLGRDDPAAIRERLKAIMSAKGASQPMGERSAGCAFKNPTLDRGIDGLGGAGQRIGAGLVIDRAGLKGLRVGGAAVSHAHANFIVAEPGRARARDVIELMDLVRAGVAERFGIALAPEVVIWSRR
jgi:UDP-N-acetylmuramate dehydrogenase